MPIQQINPEAAKQILDEDAQAIYVDVRSIPEFAAGHPIRAVNIPIMHKGGYGMEPNGDFLKVAEAVLPKDRKLIVGCLAGGRSQKACELLEQRGFSILYNVYGGFGGGCGGCGGGLRRRGARLGGGQRQAVASGTFPASHQAATARTSASSPAARVSWIAYGSPPGLTPLGSDTSILTS